MDKPERETHDLMNVKSFSQLPFIRSAVKEKSSGGAIRLFGKDFTTTDDQSNQVNENNINGREEEPNKDQTSSNNSRKFECHYCCRNFPTSQALGGHQNAHKRERQHAKRAHFQSAMVHGGLDAHDYSLMTYNRLGQPAPTNYLPIDGYHSWNGINSRTPYSAPATTRLYGNTSAYNNIAHQPLINGSPLAMWRIPTAPFNRERASVVPRHPLFNNSMDHDHRLKPLSGISGGLGSQSRLGYESKAGMQDHVSLDLHL